ncbi:MAG: pyruvate kinase [Gammaproteobacteria bacterium]|nr:pyruvate kinase [Gammaproteobacteria bacterium]
MSPQDGNASVARFVNVSAVSDRLEAILERARAFEAAYSSELAAVHPEFHDSARNLVHYLALRSEDHRDLQDNLASLGLSSLGRAERDVLGSISRVQKALLGVLRHVDVEPGEACLRQDLRNPKAQLHNKAILGDCPDGREVAIMVTLPTEVASNPGLASDMIDAGMNVARISCGHDSDQIWGQMIANVRKASEASGRDCRILIDLSGAKLRTGELLAGPRVIHIRPRRDGLGRVLAPRRLRFIPDDVSWPGKRTAVIPVPRECIELANAGDRIRIRDTRGKKRVLRVVGKASNEELTLETLKGLYIATGAKFKLDRQGAGETISYRVGVLPAVDQPIRLRVGDTLVLHGTGAKGAPAIEDADGNVSTPAHIGCQQPEIFEFIAVGAPVSFNDGKIAGVVCTVSAEELEIEITQAKPTGGRLRGNCGINFPASHIKLPGLPMYDKANLDFAFGLVDAVALSFVRDSTNIIELQDYLEQCGHKEIGIVIKIETEEAFNRLPELIFTSMRTYPAAIMIARGDLAVECGWERLAELQEEILWLCEAAHLPVIWATDVLDQGSKKGQPSRAEITDAAMSQRADCVMLNKGPHILPTIRMLDNILRRMEGHQHKKTARLRKLSIAGTGKQ